MYDYYLKFPDEETCNSILFYLDNEILMPKYDSIDIIGTINKPIGDIKASEDGILYQEMIPVPGFHVNVRHSKHAQELDEWTVTPRTPQRVWF